MEAETSSGGNTYFIDVNNFLELSRLPRQDRLITHQVMGGYLPEMDEENEKGIETVLDLACGPGEWAMGLAQTHPRMDIVGTDISHQMIDYAQAAAEARHIGNVTFRSMDISGTLDFPHETFDLVNARLVGGVLLPETWEAFVNECYRICKPGGLIRLTEVEDSHTTSEAEERLGSALYQGMHQIGRTFSPTGRRINILPVLRKLVQEAGFRVVRQRAYVLDYSSNTPLHDDWCENLRTSLQLIKPFFAQLNQMAETEFDVLYQQLEKEQSGEEYYALMFFMTLLAHKDER